MFESHRIKSQDLRASFSDVGSRLIGVISTTLEEGRHQDGWGRLHGHLGVWDGCAAIQTSYSAEDRERPPRQLPFPLVGLLNTLCHVSRQKLGQLCKAEVEGTVLVAWLNK